MNSHTHSSRGPDFLRRTALLAGLTLAVAGCTSTGGTTTIDPPAPPGGLPDPPPVSVPNPPGVR